MHCEVISQRQFSIKFLIKMQLNIAYKLFKTMLLISRQNNYICSHKYLCAFTNLKTNLLWQVFLKQVTLTMWQILKSLITSATAFGTSYNPSKQYQTSRIKIPSFRFKRVIKRCKHSQSAYSNAVAAREAAFEPFSKLTRVTTLSKLLTPQFRLMASTNNCSQTAR